MRRLAPAALLLAAAALAGPALADHCTEVDTRVPRAGACAEDPCATVWADPFPDLQDEGVTVAACADRDDPSACYGHARRGECLV